MPKKKINIGVLAHNLVRYVYPVIILLLLVACGESGSSVNVSSLPDITEFLSAPSDRFLVDIADISDGHPFKGKNANDPHQGAHLNWDSANGVWPKGGTNPENFPPIYAVADGTIKRKETYHPVYPSGKPVHYRYGLSLAFAQSNGQMVTFEYSIEPFVDPSDSSFYEPYMLVNVGDNVKKGDVIAYMYLNPSAGLSAHIHFDLTSEEESGRVSEDFKAPAIFTSSIVEAFHAKWNVFAKDGSDVIPPCIGYKLTAEENVYGTGSVTTQ
ncbi:MAG TPA: hypothetical protein QF720_08440 [Nitrospinota bacterium]|nr:hypothetical protein [Nitrospinota bacterium]|tara:strand:- start:85791 stop:86597 length:807 start_codon:yes stop_codon:yes gene_type:complete